MFFWTLDSEWLLLRQLERSNSTLRPDPLYFHIIIRKRLRWLASGGIRYLVLKGILRFSLDQLVSSCDRSSLEELAICFDCLSWILSKVGFNESFSRDFAFLFFVFILVNWVLNIDFSKLRCSGLSKLYFTFSVFQSFHSSLVLLFFDESLCTKALGIIFNLITVCLI